MTEHLPISVLIVEDLQDTADTLAQYLRLAHGYFVRTASDGEKGLKLALAEPPDVVVSDIGLPAIDGFTLAQMLSDLLSPKPLLAIAGLVYDALRRKLSSAWIMGAEVDLTFV
jgi:DNA-binding response OmpR family regulator